MRRERQRRRWLPSMLTMDLNFSSVVSGQVQAAARTIGKV